MAKAQKDSDTQAKPAGAALPREFPIPDTMPVEDEQLEAAMAAGLVEGPATVPEQPGDHLTPDTLLGHHREGRWTSREDEDERGLLAESPEDLPPAK